jgi:hypothetical protein
MSTIRDNRSKLLPLQYITVKVKFALEQATKAQTGSRNKALLFLYLGTRWRWVLNATPSHYTPQERPSTQCIRGWVGLRTSMDGCRTSRPNKNLIPGPPSL